MGTTVGRYGTPLRSHADRLLDRRPTCRVKHGASLRLEFPHRLELDTDWSRFEEYTRTGKDQITMGREHFAVRFAECRRVQFRTGAGARHLIDAQGWVHGVDFSYGFDAFPARPVVFGMEASLGSLGSAFVGSLRGSLGVLVGPVELSAGWDHRAIGDVMLSGPFLMLRGWL